ncbi:hypothetical protein SAMN05421505_13946 [Sinosporangium album]|uniref:DUF2231 domain-containing protein n=1 Tax=Sinosporangium album TaxID=504805 RepID=A0A1G8IXA3_9ACTN|nr:DUF2231 domain-containing protein [Sinosporangium album]SDI23347.1 hypothetical protein SAMN05421505_13946 [Sinosporangium album]
MVDELFGLPVHPLVVHAAVVFAPLFSLVSLMFALAPRLRERLAWLVTVLAVATPLAVLAAQLSGPALRDRVFGGQEPSGRLGELVAAHEGFAVPLLLTTLGLSASSLLLAHAGPRFGSALLRPLTLLVVLLSAAVTYYVIRAGHSGSAAVWFQG